MVITTFLEGKNLYKMRAILTGINLKIVTGEELNPLERIILINAINYYATQRDELLRQYERMFANEDRTE
jgi:hypothetical protein